MVGNVLRDQEATASMHPISNKQYNAKRSRQQGGNREKQRKRVRRLAGRRFGANGMFAVLMLLGDRKRQGQKTIWTILDANLGLDIYSSILLTLVTSNLDGRQVIC